MSGAVSVYNSSSQALVPRIRVIAAHLSGVMSVSRRVAWQTVLEAPRSGSALIRCKSVGENAALRRARSVLILVAVRHTQQRALQKDRHRAHRRERYASRFRRTRQYTRARRNTVVVL